MSYRHLREQAFSIVASRYDGQIRCNVRLCPIGGSIDVLELDHIKDDGAEHRGGGRNGKRRSADSTYRWIIKHPREAQERFQFLCHYHNRVKNQLKPEDYRFPVQLKGEDIKCQAIPDSTNYSALSGNSMTRSKKTTEQGETLSLMFEPRQISE